MPGAQGIIVITYANNETVNAGIYAATTLHAVDPDLAAYNIKSGVNIFGFTGTAALPDTGQTSVYTTNDDGTYQPGTTGKSYTDNGNGTITDNRTGLMWKKCSEPDTTTNCSGSPTAYTWANAITQCEGLSYASRTDWRLPNAVELFSITVQQGSAPLINTTYFPSTVSNAYWTSTTRATNTANALRVAFDLGIVNKDSAKTGANYVRCVRAGP